MNNPKLFPLNPLGIGSSALESLSSYVCRLAEAHSVSVYTLCKHIVAPDIGVDHAGKLSYFEVSGGHLINGIGEVARDRQYSLSRLTGIDSLRWTNLLPFESVMCARRLMRDFSAWCPICLEERLVGPEGPFESLIWSLQIVKYCPDHWIRLSEVCPYCGSKVRYFSEIKRIGCCSNCGNWLGKKYEPVTQTPKEEIDGQIRTAEIVGDLLAKVPYIEGKLTHKLLRKGFRELINLITDGNLSHFAKMIGKGKGAVSSWRSGTVTPSLEELVRISLILEVSLSDILMGQIPKVYFAPRCSAEVLHRKSTKRNSYKGSLPLLEKELRSALKETIPLSVTTICRKVGVPTRYAWHYFPKMAKEVSKKSKNFESECKEISDSAIRREISKIVRDLRNKGIYPSMRKVEKILGGKAKLRSNQMRTFWKKEVENL